MQPRRAGSLDIFLEKVSKWFEIELMEDYCQEVRYVVL